MFFSSKVKTKSGEGIFEGETCVFGNIGKVYSDFMGLYGGLTYKVSLICK